MLPLVGIEPGTLISLCVPFLCVLENRDVSECYTTTTTFMLNFMGQEMFLSCPDFTLYTFKA